MRVRIIRKGFTAEVGLERLRGCNGRISRGGEKGGPCRWGNSRKMSTQRGVSCEWGYSRAQRVRRLVELRGLEEMGHREYIFIR